MASRAELQEDIHTATDPLAKILANMVSTPEQDREFIELLNKLYQEGLGRDADAGAIIGYLPLLRSGAVNAAAITASIVASDEYRRRFIQVMYGTELLRKDPATAAEVNGWFTSGLTLDGIRDSIRSSDEYKSKH